MQTPESTVGTEREARAKRTEFSACRRYRYTLWREWNFDSMYDKSGLLPGLTTPLNSWELRMDRYLMVIGLNPSTADEVQDDPTIRRCIGFAKRWGYGALCMTNLFAWRDTDPMKMKMAVEPVGPDNDRWLGEMAAGAGMVLAAWGTHGMHLRRSEIFRQAVAHPLHCLGRNADGSPKHPLYIKSETVPVLF